MPAISGWNFSERSPELSSLEVVVNASGTPVLNGPNNFQQMRVTTELTDGAPVIIRVDQTGFASELKFYLDADITNSTGYDLETLRISLVSDNNYMSNGGHPPFSHFHDSLFGWDNPSRPFFSSMTGFNNSTGIATSDIGAGGAGGINGADQLDFSAGTFASGSQGLFDDFGIHQFLESTDGGGSPFGGSFSIVLAPDTAFDDLVMPAFHRVEEGGSASDELGGSDWNDLISTYEGGDSVYGHFGHDVLAGGGGTDNLFGGDGSDWLFGGADDDVLDGGVGGGDGTDVLDGGAGFDVADYSGHAASLEVTLAGGDRVDLLADGVREDVLRNVEDLNGGDGNDSFTGDAARNAFFGADGADTLNGAAGADRLAGGGGSDELTGGDGYDKLYGDGAPSGISLGSGVLVKELGAGNDAIATAFNISDLFSVASDTETPGVSIRGQGDGAVDYYAVTVNNPGAWIRSSVEAVAFSGLPDLTRLYDANGTLLYEVLGQLNYRVAAAGQFFIAVGAYDFGETVGVPEGGSYHLQVSVEGELPVPGVGGNDTLSGGAGNDTLDGGAGTDLADLSGATAAITFAVGTTGGAVITAAGTGTDTLISIEGIRTGSGADRLTGNGAANTFSGNGGNDTIDGGAGHDSLNGGTGTDSMTGGDGNDSYVVDLAGDKVVETNAAVSTGGYDTVNTTLNTYTLGANVERVNFIGAGNFIGFGNAGANRFQGGAGTDRFVTSAGADIYSGGMGTDSVDFRTAITGAVLNFSTGTHAGAAAGDSFSSIEKFLGSATAGDRMTGSGVGRFSFAGYGGNDTLAGSSNSDQLQGGDGDDRLIGAAGKDTLYGDAGSDTMSGGADGDLFNFRFPPFGNDLVTDFQDGTDVLQVHSSVADALSDFSIAGNGTTSVVLSLVGSPGNSITLNGVAAITVTAADVLFY